MEDMKSKYLLPTIFLAACSQNSLDPSRTHGPTQENPGTNHNLSTIQLDPAFSTGLSSQGSDISCQLQLPVETEDGVTTAGTIDVINVEADDAYPLLVSTITNNVDPNTGVTQNVLIELNGDALESLGLSTQSVISDSVGFALLRRIDEKDYTVTCPEVDTVCHLFVK